MVLSNPKSSRQTDYQALRRQHPRLIFEEFSFVQAAYAVQYRFHFILEPDISFQPHLSIKVPKNRPLPPTLLRQLGFHIGLIELISYWKAACPPTILIKAGGLSHEQVQWWKQVYFHGLGEFFYVNGLHPTLDDFVRLESSGERIEPCDWKLEEGSLIPVGGGKDSLVTLDLLQSNKASNMVFFLNATKAQTQSAEIMGYEESQIVRAVREIDPALIDLNKDGYLNGHTPFSALLGWVAVAGAAFHGKKQVVLSNEGSADESTVQGTLINHQWSKSLMFEKMFHDYVQRWILPEMKYFSLLRSWNELQIAERFSQNRAALKVFRSCNVGQKTDSWCGTCPKCLFVNIILAPYLEKPDLHLIFGEKLPLDNEKLLPILDQLRGATPTKPFECVGTIEEVNQALALAAQKPNPPHLVKSWSNSSR